jgi:hypothetical protein
MKTFEERTEKWAKKENPVLEALEKVAQETWEAKSEQPKAQVVALLAGKAQTLEARRGLAGRVRSSNAKVRGSSSSKHI